MCVVFFGERYVGGCVDYYEVCVLIIGVVECIEVVCDEGIIKCFDW